MNYYKPGDWLVTCDSCGKKMKASHTKHRWDGFIVCDSCWEPRHSHDFIKVKYDRQDVPFSRRPQETFITNVCDIASRTAYADMGTADCSMAGQTWGRSYDDILQNELCEYNRRTAIAGIGYAGCITASFNIDGYI